MIVIYINICVMFFSLMIYHELSDFNFEIDENRLFLSIYFSVYLLIDTIWYILFQYSTTQNKIGHGRQGNVFE